MKTYEEMIKDYGDYALLIEYKSTVISLEHGATALEELVREDNLEICEKEILDRMHKWIEG